MRLAVLLGCVVIAASGCETTKHVASCSPCSLRSVNCPAAGPSAPAAKPGAPTYLPPTIREVRGPGAEDMPESRPQVAAATQQQDVLLIPRWVYVPYSPHLPAGQLKIPAGSNGPSPMPSPYVQVDERVAVLPPMANQNETLEQCLQQMKVLNARIGELESKNAGHPAMGLSGSSAPQMLPLPPVPAPTLPPAK